MIARVALLIVLVLAAGPAAQGETEYLPLVRRCADVLIEKGRDRYGKVESPLFMCVISVDKLEAETDPALLDGMIRTEGRLHRRNLRGADLWEDQSLIRTLDILTERTGDAKYRAAANDEIAYFFEHCRKPTTGLLTWGTHIFWDCFADAPGGDQEGAGPHETLVREAAWERMWEVAPDRVRGQIEGMWEWHVVDKTTGLHNRHDDKARGCDFAFSGGVLIHAFAFMQKKTGEAAWKERAHLISNWHWEARDKATGLAPDAPGIADRFDGQHCMTTVCGPHAALLLRSFALTGDKFYREVALGHLSAYAKYGWDPEAKSFWGMLKLDGRPVRDDADERSPRPRQIHVYDDFAPSGRVDLWPTIMYSYEFPLIAAQSYAYAALLSDDPTMITATRRWAELIERGLPPTTGRRWTRLLKGALPNLEEAGGAYAETYARTIDFFLMAAKVLKEERWAKAARGVAEDAVKRLHDPKSGLFMGHAAKRTYEATDGVGYLLQALLKLDGAPGADTPIF